jgi:hypothetical protein
MFAKRAGTARPTRPVFSSSTVVASARVVGFFWARVGKQIKTGVIIMAAAVMATRPGRSGFLTT